MHLPDVSKVVFTCTLATTIHFLPDAFYLVSNICQLFPTSLRKGRMHYTLEPFCVTPAFISAVCSSHVWLLLTVFRYPRQNLVIHSPTSWIWIDESAWACTICRFQGSIYPEICCQFISRLLENQVSMRKARIYKLQMFLSLLYGHVPMTCLQVENIAG